jgi:hypothetical protein
MMTTTLLLATILVASPAPPGGDCDDPLPIDPAVVTNQIPLAILAKAVIRQ